ncbi:MAG TPA: hypothetical protein VIK78_00395 [Ruminiclostridium sp.]
MSDILIFFVKRVCILYIVFFILCLLIKEQRISMLFALTAGILFSVLRFALLEAVLKLLGGGENKTIIIIINLVIYLFNLVIIGVMIVLAMQFGVLTLIATLVGTLSIPIIIMINAITEALGITKNQYGQKVK